MLSHIHIFIQGSVRHWRIAAVVYVLQLALAFTIGMQVFEVMESSIGHSLSLERLLEGYDHTVMTDFLKVHGASITPLIGQLRWLLLVWLLFSVFINGGLLFSVTSPDAPTVGRFWQGGSKYFGAFLKVAAISLLLAVIWTAVLWIPVVLHLQWALEYFTTEKVAVWGVITLMLFYLAGLAVLYVLSIAARLEIILRKATIRQGFLEAWRMVRERWRALSRLLLIFTGIQLLLLSIYCLLESLIGMRSGAGILLVFFTQQVVSYLRILLRAGFYQRVEQIRVTS
ncbi:MAG: hypothetical protein IT261_08115 [Saprospiraceae bacterium]|nr:hypothetical protein [Saprospiraceae bacterium]